MYRMKMNDVSIVVAAKQNNLKAVKELLDLNVDADSTNDFFREDVALHYAIKHNNYEMVKWLIAAGANLNFINRFSYTLNNHISSYLEYNERKEIGALLKRCGAQFEDWYCSENFAA